MEILFLLIGIIIGAIIIYVKLSPKLQTVKKLDKETEEKNEQLRIDLQNLLNEYSSLNGKKEEILSNITVLQKQAEESSNALFQKSYELANEKMSQAAETMSKKYQDMEKAAEKEYLEILENYTNSFQQKIKSKEDELEKVNLQLLDLSSKLNSAVEASKRAEKEKAQKDFYRLKLSAVDIEEIKKLRSVAPFLRDSEPLNKVIWKVYYEKPYTDLIGRVVGNSTYSGIYKITNIENQMCYVGQAVNISDRWKQHIKRGIGAETPTKNKLYPAMLEYGVENFTFEVIEKVEKSKLNEREDYWQQYFHAKDFGYSIK